MQVQLIEVLNDDFYVAWSAGQYIDEQDRMSNLGLSKLRSSINEKRRDSPETPLVRCYFCRSALYLKRNPGTAEVGFHFAHFNALNQSMNCPQHHQGQPIHDLRALIHLGVQEGILHKTMKERIHRLLENDPLSEPGTVLQEARLKEGREFRKPDVQAVYNGVLTAFEVQVSRELPAMISARQAFYRNHDRRIFWVLPSFSPETVRQSLQDIANTNNNHLFVLDDQATDLSEKSRRLHLNVWYQWPKLVNSRLVYSWHNQIVAMSDIKFRKGHAFVIDVPKEEERLKAIQERSHLSKQDGNPKPTEAYADIHSSPLYRSPGWPPSPLGLWHDFIEEWRVFAYRLATSPVRKPALAALERGLSAKCGDGIFLEWLRLQGISPWALKETNFIWRLLGSAADGRLRWPSQTWKWAYNTLSSHHSRWEKAVFFLVNATFRKGDSEPNPLLQTFGSAWYEEKRESLRLRPTELTATERRLLALVAPQWQGPYLKGIAPPQYFHSIADDLYGYLLECRDGATHVWVPDLRADKPLIDPACFDPGAFVIDEVISRIRFNNKLWLPMPGITWEPEEAESKVLRASVFHGFLDHELIAAVNYWRTQLQGMRKRIKGFIEG